MYNIKVILLLALMVPAAGLCQERPLESRNSQIIDLTHELRALYDPAQLPVFLTGCTERQISSYDPTGGNDDGGSGRYSFVRRNPDSSLVMAEVYGAGVINRMWTPTPTTDTLDIFVDDSARPCMSVCYMDLFSGKVKPFLSPLCGQGAGGYYCYFPILFQRFCRIIDRGKKLRYYQVQYKRFPTGTVVQALRPELNEVEQKAFEMVHTTWTQEGDFHDEVAPSCEKKAAEVVLTQGASKLLVNLRAPGRIRGIELTGAKLLGDSVRDIWVEIRQDDESIPGVLVPVAAFFGFADGRPSMRSVLSGVRGDTCYSWFPMPFDRKIRVRLLYKGSGMPIRLSATVYYTNERRDPHLEGKFRVHYVSHPLTENDPWHVFLDTSGKGHYVGTMLWAQGERPGLPVFFEGDDSTAIDGIFRIHGTGSEDYFNGGWYDLHGKWDTARSFPISGCMYYNKTRRLTGGYRFYLSDKIPFERSIWQGIEHGKSAREPVPARYTSVSLYYSGTD
ncbi:MAG: DUF2961 domain-containing protein [Bacteroidota bacterium]|nr:DUF2961 domain-containing protein [Bacteroidota bacterium]